MSSGSGGSNRGGVFPWWEPGKAVKDEGGTTAKTVKFGDRIMLKNTNSGMYIQMANKQYLYSSEPSASSGVTFTVDDYTNPGVRNQVVPAGMNSQMLILTTEAGNRGTVSDTNGYLSITQYDNSGTHFMSPLGSTDDSAKASNQWYIEKSNFDYTTPLTYGDKVYVYNLSSGRVVQTSSGQKKALLLHPTSGGSFLEFQILNPDGAVPKMPPAKSTKTKPWDTITPVPPPKTTDWKLFLSIGVVAIVLLLGGFGLYKYYKKR